MNTDYRQKRVAEAQKFLDTLFGAVTGKHYGYLWTLQNSKTYPFVVSNADARAEMARMAIELNDGGFDVYVGVNLGDEKPPSYNRYTKEQITVQTATVTDIDCEGGDHISNDKKVYPPNFDTAEKFLPFTPSILINTGYGLHAYCVYAEPILISDDNRATAAERNNDFISVIRSRAGIFSGAVDGVGDLPRVLRMPGTFNYKCGTENAPLCHVVEYRDDRFTPADMDARLKSLLPPTPVSKPPTRPARQPSFSTGEPTDEERARAMLEKIPLKDLSENEWLSAISALKNLGFSYAEVDALNQGGTHYNERENRTRWESLTDPSFDIETLHGIAKRYGYSEKDFQREWYKLRGTKSARRPSDNDSARAGRDELIDSIFNGDASDRAFAKRLEKFCGDRVRWLDSDKRWYIYGNGVWTAGGGENSAIAHFADELAETMQQCANNDAEKKLADKFQSSKKIGCAIGLLKARASIRITLDDLNRHANLLNCSNGFVDLETGTLYPADPSLLLTKQAGAAFDPKSSSPLVEEFFKSIMPDEMTRAGLLRWLAYNLTSSTREHKFAVWTGASGANGKSTLSSTMLKLLGTYGTGLSTRALLKNPRPADANNATTSLNPLENCRAAFVDELPLNAELDSALMKNLSGGGEINLRPNYGEFRTIPNIAKINISGNFMPRLENVNDGGLQRRLLNFAFNVRFGTAERPADPQLKEKLILPENLNSLLSVLVHEAVAWYRDGLIISDAMKAETQRILDESNFVADFLEDGGQYVKAAGAEVRAKDFIDALRAACPRECSSFTKRADLVKLIAAQDGVTYCKGNHNINVFKGIGKAARDGGELIDSKSAPC